MRRVRLLLLMAVLTVAPSRVSAQVRATISAVLDSSGRRPMLQLSNLFEERTWREAVEQEGVPVRVSWKLVLWRKGGFFGDNEIQRAEWTDVVQRQALLDEYDFLRFYADRQPEPRRPYPLLGLLSIAEYGKPLTPRLPLPTDRGDYYYSAEISIGTISSEDFDRMSRFQGQDPAGVYSRLSKTLNSLLFPGKKLPVVRTATFRIP